MKAAGYILAFMSMTGLVFSMWFAAASFLVPVLLRFFIPDSLISLLITALILSALYTFIHYKLQRTIFWPLLTLGALSGGILAYVLLYLVGSSWPLVPWFLGLATFVVPSVVISVVFVVLSRGKKATAVEVEAVEPVVTEKPAEQQPGGEEKKLEIQPSPPSQPQPQQQFSTSPQPIAAAVEQPTAYPQVLVYQTPQIPIVPEKIDSEDIEDYILDFIDQKKITELVPVQAPSADGGIYPAIQNDVDIDTARLVGSYVRPKQKSMPANFKQLTRLNDGYMAQQIIPKTNSHDH
ncbi:MAG: hypothetical protein QW463_05660, partial [Candidatus Caldarchaeum sp.]